MQRKRRKAAEGLNNHRGHLPQCYWLMSKFQSAKVQTKTSVSVFLVSLFGVVVIPSKEVLEAML